MKKLVNQSKRLGVIALSTMSLVAFSACGDSSSKAEAFVKKEYPDAKILSFSEIQKEFGLKDKECLNKKNNLFATTYHFIKAGNDEVKVIEIWTDDKGNSKDSGTYSIDDMKIKQAECFN